MRTASAVPALLACAALGLTACGGDGGGGKLGKADFLAQVDRVCADADKQIDAVPTPTTAQQLGPAVDQASALFRTQLDKLHGFEGKAPDDVKDDFAKALDVLETEFPVFAELKAAGADEQKLAAAQAKGEKADKEADALARKIGLKECGKDN